MSPVRKSPSTDPPPLDEHMEDERSEVRPRLNPQILRARTITPPPLQPANPAPAMERGERIERKIRNLRLLTLQLTDADPAQRLVRLAILRRDEVLLDNLLEKLSADD